MGRRRFEEAEVRELKRGLLLRMRELLEKKEDLSAAALVYSLFDRLEFGKKGRPHKAVVDWDYFEYAFNHFFNAAS